MKHAELRAQVLLNLPAEARLFNNAGGVAQYGKRFITVGLEKGSSDLIGWTKIDKAAVFTAIELKREKEACRPVQLKFLSAVARAGGIAAVVRRVEDIPAVFDGAGLPRGRCMITDNMADILAPAEYHTSPPASRRCKSCARSMTTTSRHAGLILTRACITARPAMRRAVALTWPNGSE